MWGEWIRRAKRGRQEDEFVGGVPSIGWKENSTANPVDILGSARVGVTCTEFPAQKVH